MEPATPDTPDLWDATVATAFHPACSCAMGGSDAAACDPDLRVRGVEGNTIAIAERAADLIRG
jgi:choline dehydrogenase-like flavoprotein